MSDPINHHLAVHQQSGPPGLHQREGVVTVDRRGKRSGRPEREGPQVGHSRDPVEVEDPAIPEGCGSHLGARPVGGIEVDHVESPLTVRPFGGPATQRLGRPVGNNPGFVTDLQAFPQAVDQGIKG